MTTHDDENAPPRGKQLDPSIMRQFTGSEHWYRFGLDPKITCTDGAKYVADIAGAYWLLEEISLAQRYDERVKVEQFQVWKLAVNDDSSASLVCEDGNHNVVSTRAVSGLAESGFPGEAE